MNLRNICIIAHVDHGKTTLVDFMLKQAGAFKKHEVIAERVMDSMDLERERGITIMAKNTAVTYDDIKINIIDTPGHADFGGEVERIISMADGALLLVDAAEGPLPQTRFVLQKALRQGLKIILVINKVDRKECEDGRRIREVVDQAFDLFVELGASDEQADFPIVFACAREGWCTLDFDAIRPLVNHETTATLQPLFDTILKTIPAPRVSSSNDFQCLISNLSYSDYVGRLAVGRILSGKLQKGQRIHCLGKNQRRFQFTVTNLYTYQGLDQRETPEVEAGDIGLIAGSEEVEIGDTLTSNETAEALPRIEVEQPTLGMLFSVNNSPFSGQDGEPLQSRKLRDRLLREVRQNVALRFEETDSPDQFRVLGRGELQFAILIEQIRREGKEFMVGRPTVLMRKNSEGAWEEPYEFILADIPQAFAGPVTSMFQERKGLMVNYESMGDGGRVRIRFEIPTRGLIGVRSKFLSATRGEGIMATEFSGYKSYKGEIVNRINGAIVADRPGDITEYAIRNLEDRGIFFLQPGTKVYEGMVVGEANKDTELNVNIVREKKLTNMRASHLEALVHLQGVRSMTLEDCLEWIDEDEWIEITPEAIRMRKKILACNQRSPHRSDRLAI